MRKNEITPLISKEITLATLTVLSSKGLNSQADFDREFDEQIKARGFDPVEFHEVMNEIGPEGEGDEWTPEGF